MPEQTTAPALTTRVYDLIRGYVRMRSEKKSGISWDSFKDRRILDPKTGTNRLDVPQKYRDTCESVCTEAFLRLRSCHSRQDFVDYFTGTVCSVPQFLPRKEYEEVSAALLHGETWEDVKALAMLALSGLSRL